MRKSKVRVRDSKNPGFQYCLITDRRMYKQPLHEIAQLAEEACVDYFQLREKDLTAAELLGIAKHIRPMLVRTRFIVNGHLDVAVAADADGVHLQKDNLPVRAVREKFPDLLIGYSTHSKEEMRQAEESGASYVFVSPVYEPLSKSSELPPIGYKAMAAWIKDSKVPVFGLGGVTPANLRELFSAGCSGAAGISLFIENGYFDAKKMVI